MAYNAYAYCANNPVILMDQSGESITVACIIALGCMGILAGGHVAAKASKQQLGYVNGRWVVGGMAIGGGVGALLGWAFAGTSAAASISWAYYKATTAIGTTAYALGSAFEKWFYKAYSVNETQVSCGRFRFDAIYKNSIVELKNYNWSMYSSYTSIIRSFINQANNYMMYVGQVVKGHYGSYLIEGVTFYFSSQPPQEIIDALHNIGVTVNWLP